MRLAFEEVTGKDLQWFWDQWYYGSGHPKLEISYTFNDVNKVASAIVRQTQTGRIFKLPIAIDVYNGSDRTRQHVWLEHRTDTFSFAVNKKPDLINVDAEKILLAEKVDRKTLSEFVHQYKYAKNYVDRIEAVNFCIKNIAQPQAKLLIEEALSDPYYKLRIKVLQNIKARELSNSAVNKIIAIAKNDPYKLARVASIDALSTLNRNDLKDIFIKAVTDSSYSVAGAGLEALMEIDEASTLSLITELKKDAKGRLEEAIKTAQVLTKTDADFNTMTASFDSLSLFDKFTGYKNYLIYLGRVSNSDNFKKGVDRIVEFRDIVAGYSIEMKALINEQLLGVKAKKENLKQTSKEIKALEEQMNYIDKKVKD